MKTEKVLKARITKAEKLVMLEKVLKARITKAEKLVMLEKVLKARITKAEKLVMLGNKRVPRALKAMAAVSLLASYNPTEEQSERILDAIRDASKKVEDAFQAGEIKSGFSL